MSKSSVHTISIVDRKRPMTKVHPQQISIRQPNLTVKNQSGQIWKKILSVALSDTNQADLYFTHFSQHIFLAHTAQCKAIVCFPSKFYTFVCVFIITFYKITMLTAFGNNLRLNGESVYPEKKKIISSVNCYFHFLKKWTILINETCQVDCDNLKFQSDRSS